jgi:AraC-like DNA-binding protein
MNGIHSFGSELRACELRGIRVSETLMPGGLKLAEHAHQPGQICFVLEGEYNERTVDGSHALRAGMVQFRAPGEGHANDFRDDALTLLVSIEPERWLDICGQRPVAASALLRNLAAEVRLELAEGSDASRAALEGLALLLLARLSRDTAPSAPEEPAWLRDAVAFIDHRYRERVSLSTVAAAVGVHRATLSASFRRFRRISVGDYIRETRLRRATYALQHTNLPLDEIAVAHGFFDQAHFSRLFKKLHGASPGIVRRRSRRTV